MKILIKIFIYILLANTNIYLFGQSNFFENKESPQVFRYFFPDKIISNDYKQIIYRIEGFDALNFFGNRLQDIDQDNKTDIIYRAKEYLDNKWDFPSWASRYFIHGNIDNNFKLEFKIDTTLIYDGDLLKYFEDKTGSYFWVYTYGDRPSIKESGLSNWKSFYDRKGVVDNVDYVLDSNDEIIWFKPMLYKFSNGKFEYISNTNLKFSNDLNGTSGMFPWSQQYMLGDINNDGFKDIISAGIMPNGNGKLPNYKNINDKLNFYLYLNEGNGKLNCEILEFENTEGFEHWNLFENMLSLAINMDSDPETEFISEINYYNGNYPNYGGASQDRFLGYFDIDIKNKKIRFVKLLNPEEYLLNKNWTIYPKQFWKIPSINSNNETILVFFSDANGSPGANMTGNTIFDGTVFQQYFKVYEKIKLSNGSYSLKDVTEIYFDISESKTFSLDNSGQVYLLDVDNDGLIDIYPQLEQFPNSSRGGINQFVKYPSWNGSLSKSYYFKKLTNGKYKLTDYFNFPGFYYPVNQNTNLGDFSSDFGEHKFQSNIRIENLFSLNAQSLNDIDNDSINEILTSCNPDFLSLFTKSKVITPNVTKDYFDSTIYVRYSSGSNFIDLGDRYDLSTIKFTKDTITGKLDPRFNLEIKYYNKEKNLTHQPILKDLIIQDSLISHNLDAYPGFGDSLKNKLDSFNIKVPKLTYSPIKYVKGISPFYLRFNNDIIIKSKEFTVSPNLAPLKFSLLKIGTLNSSTFKGYEIDITNSIDLNKNIYIKNGSEVKGLKYGYEIYNGKVLIEDKLFDEINLQGYDNDTKTKIIGLKIPVSDTINYDIKIYALDTDDEKLKTYADFCNVFKPSAPIITRDAENNIVSNRRVLSWYKDGVKISDTTQKIKPTTNGIYTATTTQNGCTSSISQGYYYLTNAVANLSNGEYFKVSPNPTSGELYINYKISSSRNINISVFDINGRVVLLNKKVEFGSKVNLGSIPKGNYIIQVKDDSGRLVASQKLVKE